MDGQTDMIKPICPLNFFEVGGIKRNKTLFLHFPMPIFQELFTKQYYCIRLMNKSHHFTRQQKRLPSNHFCIRCKLHIHLIFKNRANQKHSVFQAYSECYSIHSFSFSLFQSEYENTHEIYKQKSNTKKEMINNVL